MAGERPSLGFEYEIALARVDVSQALTFAETPYPALSGEFEVITCTREVQVQPPAQRDKFLRNGYNPAAQVIPEVSELGRLRFDCSDRAGDNQPLAYLGSSCVARVVTKVDDEILRTFYCSYFIPRLTVDSGDPDGVGAVAVEGPFSLLSTT